MDINGHALVMALPEFAGDRDVPVSWYVVLKSKYHVERPEWIMAWVPSLDVDSWGQGHYYSTCESAVAAAYFAVGVHAFSAAKLRTIAGEGAR